MREELYEMLSSTLKAISARSNFFALGDFNAMLPVVNNNKVNNNSQLLIDLLTETCFQLTLQE
jgi:hypothetical protein